MSTNLNKAPAKWKRNKMLIELCDRGTGHRDAVESIVGVTFPPTAVVSPMTGKGTDLPSQRE